MSSIKLTTSCTFSFTSLNKCLNNWNGCLAPADNVGREVGGGGSGAGKKVRRE